MQISQSNEKDSLLLFPVQMSLELSIRCQRMHGLQIVVEGTVSEEYYLTNNKEYSLQVRGVDSQGNPLDSLRDPTVSGQVTRQREAVLSGLGGGTFRLVLGNLTGELPVEFKGGRVGTR